MQPTGIEDITLLELDHPGASDQAYRRRRDEISSAVSSARRAGVLPSIEYSQQEHETWQTVFGNLSALHATHAATAYLDARNRLPIFGDRIPDLRELSHRLDFLTGFHIIPIEGLIEPRVFLSSLAVWKLCSTLYIRHHSRPEYTPEPDIVHEVLGHVPLLADPSLARLSHLLGRAAMRATDEEMVALDRLYWFTVEFGVIDEPQGLRAYGAGLLSSFGELQHALSGKPEIRMFSLEEVMETSYDFSKMQDLLFVIPDFAFLERELQSLIRA